MDINSNNKRAGKNWDDLVKRARLAELPDVDVRFSLRQSIQAQAKTVGVADDVLDVWEMILTLMSRRIWLATALTMLLLSAAWIGWYGESAWLELRLAADLQGGVFTTF